MDTDKKEPTELSTVETAETGLQVAPSPLMGIIAAASTDGNVDADKLMKLLEANERYEENEAKKAYHVAIAAFQEELPNIVKDAQGHNSKYAKLPGVIAIVAPLLSKNGLSHSWTTKCDSDAIIVTCKITHKYGHSEETSLSAAADGSGNKNSIQALGSTVTYLKRYTLEAALGLAEEDDDGNGAADPKKGPPDPTPEEQKRLDAMYDAMEFFVPDGLTLDRERARVVIYARAEHYPPANKTADSCAKWLVDILNKDNSWETVTKAS